ncbi:PAS domain S-box protein [Crocosphaera chwakensis]|uniref:histidine kinase n=1 Tax=Crocosphaera chwakensis CCY0110 TaxID=391612 RepID=A3ILK1_9CHRO|nr:PAS domain S-box protein [Crocosphaera chwakensis]EAZ92652.1 Multi-sensor Hybrid Histidine Kinase [Crocosphaera chwakensis CCY0110]
MTTQRTVLVIANSKEDDITYQQQLQQDRSIVYKILLGRSNTTLSALSQSTLKIDGILLELGSPHTPSLQLLSQLKKQTNAPIIVIDGGDTEIAVQAFKNGADDYLIKHRTTPDDLCLAMRTAIENAELKQELQRSQETFRTSVENMLDCFGIFSAMRDDLGKIVDFRIDYLNEAACQNNQMPKAMQIGRGLCEILPAHRQSGLFDEYCRVVETGKPLIKDSLIYDDTYGDRRLIRAFDIRASKLNDGFVASWRDVTAHRQLELELNQTITHINQHQQTTLALQQSQERLNLAMKAASMGSWDWNIQTGEVNWSSNLENLFGMSPGSFDGTYETVRAMIHPEDLPKVEQALQRALYNREEYNIEFRFIKPDGSLRWALGLGRVFYDDEGNPIMMTGVDMDISHRKQIETALRASETKLRGMTDNAPVMIWVTDSTGSCTYLNQRWYDFTGQREATALGFGWLDAVHPEDSEAARGIFLKANEKHESFRLEYRLRHHSGQYHWAIDAAHPWFGENGKFKGYIGAVIDISDRKQAEEALRHSEERYRTLFESMSEGFCVIKMLFDPDNQPIDYCFLETNPAFEQQTGLSQAVGKTARQLLPDLEPHWFETYGKVALTGESIRFEHGSDVMARWFDVSAFRIGLPEEGKVAILFEEISERKQTERKLQENALRFHTLADNISQFAWMANEQGWIFWYNQRWFDYTGTNLEEMQGWGWQKVHHPDHVKRVTEKINQCFATGEIWEDMFPLRSKTGEYRWFLSRAIPIRDEQGKVLRWFGTNTDITELREAENALRQSEERYRCLTESIPQLVWTANREGELLDVNQRWIEFTGLSLEQARADGWEAVVHPEDLPVLREQWTEAVQRGTPYQAEGRMRRMDGTYRWFLHQAIPQGNEPGKMIKWYGTATDIDVQKQLELERDRLLAQEQAAREVAERANRIKDEFLAVLSHELRSPLNPILGWSQLLQVRKLDEAQTAEALHTIERNAKLQTQLIDDLLDVAKILQGKLSLTMTSVNLAKTIEAAIETVKQTAKSKSIALESQLPNIGQVSGDEARLQQIVWNLLSNGIKFTPSGGQVKIHLKRVGSYAEILVKDTGKGISPDFLPHIFESFRQEDASITRKFGGLGLGLAIVSQLVEAHGGTIRAESPGEGLGATFTVQLPLLDAESEPQLSRELPQLAALDLTGVRVLAVDDDPDARALITGLLSEYGAEVLTVASAPEVLANLESFQPDVLVSDIGMPDLDGYSLIRQVRALPAHQGGQVPAIALTAYVREVDHQRAIDNGYQCHVSKPLESEPLIKAILVLTGN